MFTDKPGNPLALPKSISYNTTFKKSIHLEGVWGAPQKHLKVWIFLASE